MSLLPWTTLHSDSEHFVCRCVIIKGTGEFEKKKLSKSDDLTWLDGVNHTDGIIYSLTTVHSIL
jgi:hypothetical protein